ncbi:hypothetical protein OIV83_004469 [Microbotryomycetes sp. JL201]|nr:hypothetical protein OIV83_004469 [Microbotryomycetes sp. JL201]
MPEEEAAGQKDGRSAHRLLLALRKSVTSEKTDLQAELDLALVETGLDPATVKPEFIAVATDKAREIKAILLTPIGEARAKVGTLAFWSRCLAPAVPDLAVFASSSQEAIVGLARGARPSDILQELERRDARDAVYVWQGSWTTDFGRYYEDITKEVELGRAAQRFTGLNVEIPVIESHSSSLAIALKTRRDTVRRHLVWVKPNDENKARSGETLLAIASELE